MWRSHTWYEAISRLPAFVYLNRFFHKQLIPFLALLWHFIWWLWGGLFVGVLGNYLYTYFATCTPKSCNISITDPRTWPLIQSHPLLTAITFILVIVLTLNTNLAYRSQQKSKHINEMKEYVLKRVNHLDPHNDIDIFPYIEQLSKQGTRQSKSLVSVSSVAQARVRRDSPGRQYVTSEPLPNGLS